MQHLIDLASKANPLRASSVGWHPMRLNSCVICPPVGGRLAVVRCAVEGGGSWLNGGRKGEEVGGWKLMDTYEVRGKMEIVSRDSQIIFYH